MDLSIIITSYNYALYIEQCIESCLMQNNTYLNYEIIVVDDGSTDKTPLLLDKINNKVLKKYRIKNSGIEVASNFGFSKSFGKYIMRVDADDRLLPNCLHYIQESLTDKYNFFYSDYEVIDSEGRVLSQMKLPAFNSEEIRARGDFLATGTVYSSDILKNFSYYTESTKNSGLENYELILRLLEAEIVGKHIPRCLFSLRRHSLNMSVSKKNKIIRNGASLFRRFSLGKYTTNQYHPYNTMKGMS